MRRLDRSVLAYVHDLAMAALSVPAALYLRVGREFWDFADAILVQATLLFAAVAAVVFWRTGLHRGIWRYASLTELIAIARAVTLTVLIFLPLMFLLTRLEDFPRSMLVINWLVLMILLGGPRVLYRAVKDGRLRPGRAPAPGRAVPVVLVGAGDGAELFLRATDRNPDPAYRAVAMIDVAGTRVGRDIRGLRILGGLDDLARVVEVLAAEGLRPQRLIVTDDRIAGAVLGRLLEAAEGLGLAVSRMPRPTELRVAEAEAAQIRPIAIEDLLGRPQAVLDRAAIARLVAGRRVLVTGAGGTIGGELARQIAALGPARLALIDQNEFGLYTIDLEIAERHPALPRASALGDVRDRARIAALIEAERPEIVFHAAALKHVHLVEAQPEDGALTNAAGTRNVADACRAARVGQMVMISTDKAVNPAGVMGATKRLAESYCQALDLQGVREGGTRFVTVRFGNVLGSTGSVVPLFQRQLAAGGPLTVTHPDIKRYFMTAREAVELVLQAAAFAAEGDGTAAEGRIFVLDMGEPVRIRDLARQMIRLAGLRPEVDVRIEYTGLRPGEKLEEELFHDAESLAPTPIQGILLASPRAADAALLARGIDEIEEAARQGRRGRVLDLLAHLVPEYRRSVPEARLAVPDR